MKNIKISRLPKRRFCRRAIFSTGDCSEWRKCRWRFFRWAILSWAILSSGDCVAGDFVVCDFCGANMTGHALYTMHIALYMFLEQPRGGGYLLPHSFQLDSKSKMTSRSIFISLKMKRYHYFINQQRETLNTLIYFLFGLC